MDVRGKVAMVTGSARGLGKGYAEALLKKGAKVVLTDILVDRGLETEKAFKSEYGEEHVLFIKGDVTSQQDMEGVFETTMKSFGGLDIVINNAGIGAFRSPQVTFDINTFSVIRCCELAVKHMSIENGGQGGVVVNISSTAGLYTFKKGCAIFPPSKHAVCWYTEGRGKQLTQGNSGIRLLGLCPSDVKIELTKNSQDMEAAGDPGVNKMPNIDASQWKIELTKNSQDLEADCHPKVIKMLQNVGGWTLFDDVVDACMKLIETDIPGGSLVQIDASGMKLAKAETMALEKIE